MTKADAAIACMALALAFAGTTAQAPAPAQAPTEVPAAVPSDLPEIGRTRATSPACAAMRDLVIPSFAAARKADARFSETQTRLPKYAEIRADAKNDRNKTHDDSFRESMLSRLEQDAANLLGYSAFIGKALGDPRLSADSKDPDVQAERAQLQALYEMQQARAKMLAQLAARERVTMTQTQMAEVSMSGGRRQALPVSEDASPNPFETGAPGMPTFSGIAFADKATATNWGIGMAKAVAEAENRAAKSFLPLAQRCR
jgi:hypothetical protein